MKKITFICFCLLFTIAVMGSTSEKKIAKTFLEKQEVQEAIQDYLAVGNTTNTTDVKIGFIDFFNQLNEGVNTRTKKTNLKSATVNTHKLDSLFVERWNESAGILETSQLETWTWYENGRGKSWELYDMDSVSNQWAPNDKEEYEWDTDGNKTLHVDYDPDTINGGWLLNGKEIFSFDSNGNELSYLRQFINQTSAEWENNLMKNSSYDINGNYTESTTTAWDTLSNEWVNYEKEVLSYDENDSLLKDEFFIWDTTQNDWLSSMFVRYEYDEYGYVIVQELLIDEFFFHTLIAYTNDSDGNEIEALSYMWDFTTMSYVLILKNEHTYAADGKELTWAHFAWDAASSDWLIDWEYNYRYDEGAYLIYRDVYVQNNELDSLMLKWKIDYVNNVEGKPILTNKMNWEPTKNEWIPNYIEINEHDMSGNFLFHSEQKYDTISNQWVDVETDGYSYDLSVSFSDISYPNSWPIGHLSNLVRYDQYSHAMLQEVYSEMKNGLLETTKKYTFYYSSITSTAIPELEDRKAIVFPNPATDFVAFELENTSISTSVELYDLQGRKVISKLLPPNKQIAINHLKSGIYVYRLIQGSAVKQGKIIKN